MIVPEKTEIVRKISLIEIIIVFFCIVSAIAFTFSRFGRYIELKLFDLRVNFRNLKINDSPVRLIYITDKCIEVMGRWPWRRRNHAYFLDLLKNQKISSIVFDILFIERDKHFPEDDLLFTKAVKNSGNIFLPEYFILYKNKRNKIYTAKERVIPFSPLKESVSGTGFVNANPDIDGVTRRFPLFIQYKKRLYFSLPLVIAAKYLNVNLDDIVIKKNSILLKGSLKGDILIPINKKGEILINYYGKSFFPKYSFLRIITAKEFGFLRNTILFIGLAATGTVDLRATPISTVTPMVNVLATVTDNIINNRFLYLASNKLTITLLVFIGICVSAVLLFFSPKKSFLYVFFIIVTFIIVGFYLFVKGGIVLNFTAPLSSIFFNYIGLSVYQYIKEEREKTRIKNLFKRYVASQVVDEILKNKDKVQLGGSRKEVTVLFADIRGFTSLSEQISPEKVVLLLNEFFSFFTDIVLKYNGTLDKFIGDAVMAVYGAPLTQQHHLLNAISTALEVKEKFHIFKEKLKMQGLPSVGIGIGINSGEVIVGNIGSYLRVDYTVIGDDVNLASRLQEIAQDDKIVIPEKVYNKISPLVKSEYLGRVDIKGKKEPISIYSIEGWK